MNPWMKEIVYDNSDAYVEKPGVIVRKLGWRER